MGPLLRSAWWPLVVGTGVLLTLWLMTKACPEHRGLILVEVSGFGGLWSLYSGWRCW